MSLMRIDPANRCRWHWCPACELEHPLPDSWTFNGNELKPTFSPSFLQRFGRDRLCHYIITDGRIAYCSDSKHELAGQTIDMPPLPVEAGESSP